MLLKRKKAQASMMEYLIMTFFMMIIISMFVLMLIGIQFLNINAEASQQKIDRSMVLLKTFSKTPIFTKDNIGVENPVFYGKKLTAAADGDFCENELGKLFGSLWSMSITIIEDTGTQKPGVLCDMLNYNTYCNKWVFCEIPSDVINIITREIPVNVYMESTGQTHAALMKVSTYE